MSCVIPPVVRLFMSSCIPASFFLPLSFSFPAFLFTCSLLSKYGLSVRSPSCPPVYVCVSYSCLWSTSARLLSACPFPMLFVGLSSCPSDHLNIVHTLSPVLLPSVSLSNCSPINLFTHVTVHLPRIVLCPSLPPVHTVHFSVHTALPPVSCPCSPVDLSFCLPVFYPSGFLSTCPSVHLCPSVYFSFCILVFSCLPVPLFTCVLLSSCPSVYLCPPACLSFCILVFSCLLVLLYNCVLLSTCPSVHLCTPVHMSLCTLVSSCLPVLL